MFIEYLPGTRYFIRHWNSKRYRTEFCLPSEKSLRLILLKNVGPPMTVFLQEDHIQLRIQDITETLTGSWLCKHMNIWGEQYLLNQLSHLQMFTVNQFFFLKIRNGVKKLLSELSDERRLQPWLTREGLAPGKGALAFRRLSALLNTLGEEII